MLMDAGTADDLPDGVMGKGQGLREWLRLAPRPLSEEELASASVTKPDIVMLPGITAAQLSAQLQRGERLLPNQRIVLIEIGYGQDTMPDEKRAQKAAQHAALAALLQNHGFKVEFRQSTHCIPLGHCGSVYTSLGELMTELKVSGGQTRKLCRKLVRHAARMAHTIVCTRRQLESAMAAQSGQTGPVWRWPARGQAATAGHKRKRGDG
jgi:hypothetical protein